METSPAVHPREESVAEDPGKTRQAPLDDEGSPSGIINIDIKSVKPYKTQDEYLYAMKEDLAEWFNAMYGVPVTVEDFFEQLETGVVLCQHANAFLNFVTKQTQGHSNNNNNNNNHRYPINLPASAVVYRSVVQPGTFHSRDNVSNFIAWCRRALGIPDTLLFETEDLVSRKNERSVVLCILEVGRRGASYGMLAPRLVQFEAEIEAEMAEEESGGEAVDSVECSRNQQLGTCSASKRQKPWIEVDMMSLDEMVRLILSKCTCEHQFPMVRVSEGKYRYGDSQSLIFLRILRSHVMVRIGGGWDTLECFLDRYDPCRCKSKDHRGTLAFASKSLAANSTESPKKPISPQKSVTGQTQTHSSHQDISQSCQSGSPTKSSSAVEIFSREEILDPSTSSHGPISEPAGPSSNSTKPFESGRGTKPETDSRRDSKRNSDPETRVVSGLRRTPSPLAPPPPGGETQTTKGHGPREVTRGGGGGCKQNESRPTTAKPVPSVRAHDTRPSSTSPCLARTSGAFRSSSGDLNASSEYRRVSLPKDGWSPADRRSLSRTDSGSSSSQQQQQQRTSVCTNNTRRRSESRGSRDDAIGGVRRLSSMDATKWRAALVQLTPKPGNVKPTTTTTGCRWETNDAPKVVLSKSEPDGRRRSGPAKSQSARNSGGGASFARRMNGVKLGFTGDHQILPSYTRRRTDQTADRALSVDAASAAEASSTKGAFLSDDETAVSRTAASLQLPLAFPNSESCTEDEVELNARMELLYEQYRAIELGIVATAAAAAAAADGEANRTDRQAGKKPSMATELKRGGDGTGRRQFSEKSPNRATSTERGDKLNVRRTTVSTSKPLIRPKSSPTTRGTASRKDGEGFKPIDQTFRGEGFGRVTTGKVNQFPGRTSSHVPDNGVRPSVPARLTATGKNRALSRSRESVFDGGGPLRRTAAQQGGLCRSLTDISDKRLLVLRTVPIHKATDNSPAGARKDADADVARAKPRKDDRLGPPTRIPHPVGDKQQQQRRRCFDQSSLKRFDSGVDITNISQNGDNGNYSVDEDASMYGQWTVGAQCTEACSLSDQKLAYSSPPPMTEEEFY